MNRFQIAQYIALGATAVSAIGFCVNHMAENSSLGSTLMALGILIGMVSYIFGGFLTMLKMAGGIAKWGWFVAPFPYDLMTVLGAFLVAVIAFVFFPIIPVRKAYKESGLY